MKDEDTDYLKITRDILMMAGNEHTEVEIKNNRSSYYFFMNDIIYLSKEQLNKNEFIENLILISHEIIHSLQSKVLHVINFILSNIEIILFLFLIIANAFVSKIWTGFEYGYLTVSIISIITRFFIEMEAVIKSIKLVRKRLKSNDIKYKYNVEKINKFKTELLTTFPIMILSLFGFKILRIVIVALIN